MYVDTTHPVPLPRSRPGDNKWGQLGREDNSTRIGDDPDELGDNLVGVQVGGTVTEMALGESHTCMLLESAEVACFGRNDAGQLGLGDTEDRGTAVGDVGETVDFGTGLSAVAVTSGCEHTCALLDDGSVKCFGENNYGQLGQVRRGGGQGRGDVGGNQRLVCLRRAWLGGALFLNKTRCVQRPTLVARQQRKEYYYTILVRVYVCIACQYLFLGQSVKAHAWTTLVPEVSGLGLGGVSGKSGRDVAGKRKILVHGCSPVML